MEVATETLRIIDNAGKQVVGLQDGTQCCDSDTQAMQSDLQSNNDCQCETLTAGYSVYNSGVMATLNNMAHKQTLQIVGSVQRFSAQKRQFGTTEGDMLQTEGLMDSDWMV